MKHIARRIFQIGLVLMFLLGISGFYFGLTDILRQLMMVTMSFVTGALLIEMFADPICLKKKKLKSVVPADRKEGLIFYFVYCSMLAIALLSIVIPFVLLLALVSQFFLPE